MSDPLASPAVVDDDDDVDSDRPAALIDAGASSAAPPAAPLAAAVAAEAEAAPQPPPPAAPAAPPAAPTPPPAAPPPAASSATETVSLSSDAVTSAVMGAGSWDQLLSAVEPVSGWEYTAEQTAGVERAKTYVAGSDKDVLCGFFVSSINEWKLSQPRVIVLSRTAYYRVTYSHKTGRIDHYHKTPLQKIRVLEKTATGLKVFLTEQDGNAGIGKAVMGLWNRNKPKDEFEHAREYLPMVASGQTLDVTTDIIAAVFHKGAELCSKSAPVSFAVPSIITTEGRKNLLAERKEAVSERACDGHARDHPLASLARAHTRLAPVRGRLSSLALSRASLVSCAVLAQPMPCPSASLRLAPRGPLWPGLVATCVRCPHPCRRGSKRSGWSARRRPRSSSRPSSTPRRRALPTGCSSP